MDIQSQAMDVHKPLQEEDKDDGLPHFANGTVSIPMRNKAHEIVARTVVDAADYEKLKDMSVFISTGPSGKSHAATYVDKKQMWLSHFIGGTPPEGQVKKYIDGDRMNNCRANLHNCTKSAEVQSRNRPKKEGAASKYIGVTPCNAKWQARAENKHKKHYLGTFDVEIEAAKAYDRFVLRHYGALGKTNGVLDEPEVAAVLSGDLVEEKKEKAPRALPKGVYNAGAAYEARWKDENGKYRSKNYPTSEEAEVKHIAECQRVLTVLEQRHMAQPIKRNAKGVAVIATNQMSGVSYEIMVSDRHWYELARYSWNWGGDSTSFPQGDVNGKHTKMHSYVWELEHPGEEIPKGHELDHIYHDHADCRVESLRVLTKGGNMQNKRKRQGLTSKYVGAYRSKGQTKWQAQIGVNHKTIPLGSFTTQKAAAKGYNEAVDKYYPGGMKNEISDDDEDDDNKSDDGEEGDDDNKPAAKKRLIAADSEL